MSTHRILDPRAGGMVLVTGGCGFLGRQLVDALVARGHSVRVLDDLSTGRPDLPAGVELVVGSVLDRAVVDQAADGASVVFHLAGVVGMRLATSQARAAFETATAGTRTVLAATGGAPAVLYSSSAVYGFGGSGPMREDQPVSRAGTLRYDGGREGYATGKLELERIGAGAAAKGRPVLVLRPFNVVGAGQVSTYGMVLPSFVEQARAGLPLTVYGSGEQRRCFTGAPEFTDLVLQLVTSPRAWGEDATPVNVGCPHETTIRRLAELVVAATGSRSVIQQVPYERVFPGRTDVRRRVPAVDRLRELCGEPRWPTVEELVRRAVADEQSPPATRAAAVLPR